MRKLYFFTVALFMCLCASSQVVTIPDANFKAILLEASPSNEIAKNLSGLYFKIDANNDSEIQVSEAIEVKQLNINGTGRNITSLVGILNFTNLEILNCNALHCPTLNLSGMSSLHQLNCWQSGIDTLNLTGLSGLEILFCGGNNFTQLDLRGLGLTNLTLLECGNSEFLTDINVNGLNSLENLLIGGNPIMTGLHCSQNQLTNLSLADLPNLSTLDCANNLLTTLNLNSYPSIQNLDCSGNQLASLFIKNGVFEGSLDMSDNPDLLYVCTDTAQLGSVQALITSYGYTNCIVDDTCSLTPDIVSISDANFITKLLEANPSNFIAKNLNGDFFKIDANDDSQIQVNEALQVSYLDVQHDFSSPDNPFITSLDGILSFSNLQELNCANNQLTTLNLNGLVSLVKLDCSLNQLTSINLNGLTNLQELITAGTGNQFSGSLNVSGLNNLRILICAFNGLPSLNVNGLTNLRTLSCGFNNFTTLNVSTLTNLEELYCSSAGLLTSLDVTGLTNLRELGCSDNFNLQEIHCSQNQLTSLNLNGLPNLATLEITDNLLTTLNVNSLTSLQNLDCSGNQLTSLLIKNGVIEGTLDFSDNPGLLYVCADVAQIASVQSLVTSYGYVNCEVDALCSSGSPNVVVIPDASFKATLLQSSPSNQIAKNLNGEYFAIDSNNDSEIQQSEAEQVSSLDVKFSGIASMEGILSFTNLNYLNCRGNILTELHLGGLTNLQVLRCSNNWITVLDLVGISNLLELHCSNNRLTAINAEDFPNLEDLHCDNNFLTTLNLNSLLNLISLHCSGNQLTSLFIKNGKAEELEINSNHSLEYICADDFQLDDVQFAIDSNNYVNCTVNTYCSFTPGGTFYTINGNNRVDLNGNGCDVTDQPLFNAKYIINDGTTTDAVIANATGLYSFSVEEGTHTITPVLENPYFSITPSTATVTFPTQSSPFIQNFCCTPNGVHYDLEVSMFPVSAAVPGFSAQYIILFKNKGTQTQSGTVTIFFDETSSLSSMPLDFTDLKPLETRSISLSTGINSPMDTPPVNEGDVLNYLVTITSPATDETPNDNTFALNQTVVNSFDPNDKTCLEGATLPKDKVGDYVHYMIRFENTGTFPAQNIVVKDVIDTDKFDLSSLVPVKGSHDFYTSIKENIVEFIFENINLPFDDVNNDGFVVFKIKTKPTLADGDTFSNTASIYFDYNFPIETNLATTMIEELKEQDFGFSGYFLMYPNPVKNVLNIETMQTIKISSINIYNQLGQLVLVVPSAQNVSKVDVSSLASGNYFIKINSDKGTSNTKFIKQ